MSFAAHNPPLKMRANTAATCTNCMAVALTGLPAAFVSFQHQQPGLPPTENVDSAVFPCLPPCNSAEVVQFVQQILHKLHHLQHFEHLTLPNTCACPYEGCTIRLVQLQRIPNISGWIFN